MSDDLIARREQAMDHADKLIEKAWPERKGAAYLQGMQLVASKLVKTVAEMQACGIHAVEQSRTYRYLGSVCSDLAPALGKRMLEEAREAYLKAEALLEGHEDPLEHAKLDFNLANTLRLLDANDIDQLQEAERRLLSARKVFEMQSLPQHIASAEEALTSTRCLLKAAPLANSIARSKADMEHLEAKLQAGEKLDEIAKEMEEVQQRNGGVAGLYASLQGLVADLPESAKQEDCYGMLMKQMEDLTNIGRGVGDSMDPSARSMMQLLRDKLGEEEAAGRVTSDRARTLASQIGDFLNTMESGGDDIQSLMRRTVDMRSKIAAKFANLHYLSHGIDRPPEGSRAAHLVELCWVLRLFLLEEMNWPMKPEGDGKAALELNIRASDVDKRLYEAGSDDARALVVEEEVLRPFAVEVRNFAARHHPLLARPIWASARAQVATNSVLFSGSSKTRKRVDQICTKLGLQLISIPKGDAIALARFKQLQESNVTIFEISVRKGREQAAVAYELGIARTLGKPVVVLARHGIEVPFDIDVEPVRISGTAQDNATISEAIDQSLVWTMPRLQSTGPTETIDYVLSQYHLPHPDTYVDQSLKQLERLRADPDPVPVTATLKTLVSFLNDGHLSLIHPAWSPVYPNSGRARLFHIMPFGPSWADAAARRVEKVCQRADVEYVRGDRVRDSNIIRSIWEEINRATHVLVDLTDYNANVALELGIAHTLGRPTLVIGQAKTLDRPFPMIAKLRIHPYKKTASPELDALANNLLRSSLA